MKHYAPQPTHIVPAIPAVSRVTLLQYRKQAIEAQIASEHRTAREEVRPANVKVMSAVLRAVKKDLARVKP